MKTKTTHTPGHIDVCHKGCKEVHVFCDWKGCAKQGEHFASDHVSIYARAAAAKSEGR